jgi:hypothetical protein
METLTTESLLSQTKELFDEHISKTRLTDDKQSKCYVFDNQIQTAKDIIFNFWINQNRWCLLFAEMQSGKSGTFFSVPYIISRNSIIAKKLNIDMFEDEINVFLLTGMNEKELIEQFEKDIFGFTGMDIQKNVLHNSEMRKFLTNDEKSWSTSDRNVISKMRKNSLILIDESHYGSDKTQILNKFLTKVLLINPNGDNDSLKRNNIYVVSISATPMAEFIEAKISDFKKKIVPLKNSNGYYGISEMFKNGKIKTSYDLKDDKSVDLFLYQVTNLKKNGYILVRCSAKQQSKIERRMALHMMSISTVDYNAYSRTLLLDNMGINDLLDEKISNKKIIFLKGLLRAGKRVNTQNVIMVHDTSESKVDTTVQSLLGRCCGYGKNTDIDIFCDKLSAEKYKNWIESGYDLNFVPDKSKNVSSSGIWNVRIESIHNPIEITVPSSTKQILNIKRKSKVDKINILKSLNDPFINSIINFGSLDTDYTIGSIFNVDKMKNNSSYQKQYLDVVTNKIFMGDYKPKEEEVGKIIFSAAFEVNDNKIVVSFGKVIKPEVQTNVKSMYHESNTI